MQHVPVEILAITSLVDLRLSNNMLESLPEEIGLLSQLKVLHVTNNKLRSLPEQALVQLKVLEELCCEDNKLESVPDKLCRLFRVRVLRLSRNRLRELPAKIGRMNELQVLDANVNRLRAVPESLGALKNLRRLCLQKNRIRTMPMDMSKMTSLQVLNVNSNMVREINPELAQLPCLRELRFGHNRVSRVADNFGDGQCRLTLEVLWLMGNRAIADVPRTLHRCRKLIECRVEDTPIRSPPPYLAQQGIKVIRKYSRHRQIRIDCIRVALRQASIILDASKLSPRPHRGCLKTRGYLSDADLSNLERRLDLCVNGNFYVPGQDDWGPKEKSTLFHAEMEKQKKSKKRRKKEAKYGEDYDSFDSFSEGDSDKDTDAEDTRDDEKQQRQGGGGGGSGEQAGEDADAKYDAGKDPVAGTLDNGVASHATTDVDDGSRENGGAEEAAEDVTGTVDEAAAAAVPEEEQKELSWEEKKALAKEKARIAKEKALKEAKEKARIAKEKLEAAREKARIAKEAALERAYLARERAKERSAKCKHKFLETMKKLEVEFAKRRGTWQPPKKPPPPKDTSEADARRAAEFRLAAATTFDTVLEPGETPRKQDVEQMRIASALAKYIVDLYALREHEHDERVLNSILKRCEGAEKTMAKWVGGKPPKRGDVGAEDGLRPDFHFISSEKWGEGGEATPVRCVVLEALGMLLPGEVGPQPIPYSKADVLTSAGRFVNVYGKPGATYHAGGLRFDKRPKDDTARARKKAKGKTVKREALKVQQVIVSNEECARKKKEDADILAAQQRTREQCEAWLKTSYGNMRLKARTRIMLRDASKNWADCNAAWGKATGKRKKAEAEVTEIAQRVESFRAGEAKVMHGFDDEAAAAAAVEAGHLAVVERTEEEAASKKLAQQAKKRRKQKWKLWLEDCRQDLLAKYKEEARQRVVETWRVFAYRPPKRRPWDEPAFRRWKKRYAKDEAARIKKAREDAFAEKVREMEARKQAEANKYAHQEVEAYGTYDSSLLGQLKGWAKDVGSGLFGGCAKGLDNMAEMTAAKSDENDPFKWTEYTGSDDEDGEGKKKKTAKDKKGKKKKKKKKKEDKQVKQ